MGPWHLKADFQLLDDHGQPKESGTFEEFWKSPNTSKAIYSSPSYTRTIWQNDSGSYATSDLEWPGDVEWMIRRSLFDVVPEPGNFRDWELTWHEAASGPPLRCIVLRPIYSHTNGELPTFCFEHDRPILRYGSEYRQRYQAVFNNIDTFQGSYIPHDVRLMRAGKAYFQLRVEVLEQLPDSTYEIFRQDGNAVRIAHHVLVDSDLRDMHTTYKAGFPPTRFDRLKVASQNNSEVIVQVLVNEKGKVIDARPVQGDPVLEYSCVIAARRWEFTPYIVQGQPTPFYTELEFF